MENKFETKVHRLSQLTQRRFVIPSYQRPYVWGGEQINKLLSDFKTAYEKGDSHYFIGTVLTSQKGVAGNSPRTDELIDGQQRFTTLWLIAVSFKILEKESSITGFLKYHDELRFDFAIRKQIKAYLLSLLEKKKNEKNQYSDEEVQKDEYLVKIAEAVTTIVQKLETFTFENQEDRSLKGLGDYIFENVLFVMNTAPADTNLNKLFTTINNSGVQLEQTDILKSTLLRHISNNTPDKSERVLYSKIWEACEDMGHYFERNVRKLFPETQWLTVGVNDFKSFDAEKFKYQKEGMVAGVAQPDSGIELSVLIGEKENRYNSDDIEKLQKVGDGVADESDIVNCRSIIQFPQLLLHAYRIYLCKNESDDFSLPFHSKNLLKIFETMEAQGEDYIKGFFRLLWEVRYAFDQHIVKWIQKSDDKEEELSVASLHHSDKETNRFFTRRHPEGKEPIAMLQSVLYFTGNYNTQIWLSPFIKRLLDGEDPLVCLESIDNELSLSKMDDKATTFALMDKSFRLAERLDIEKELGEKAEGTQFKHYWFQKLEYILFKNWEDKNDSKFKEFRITSKNSVEHVFPQNHEFNEKLEEGFLHSFGNLGLLSVSQNSSYSNQAVAKKKVDFDYKHTYDSLKLAHIYNHEEFKKWDVKEVKTHQDEMIKKMKNHYGLEDDVK